MIQSFKFDTHAGLVVSYDALVPGAARQAAKEALRAARDLGAEEPLQWYVAPGTGNEKLLGLKWNRKEEVAL